MIIAVLADEILKKEFLAKQITGKAKLIWADSVRSLSIIEADVYIDLLFELDYERISHLIRLLSKPVLVNSVVHTLRQIGHPFVRINAWPGLLENAVTEVAVSDPAQEKLVKSVFNALGWSYRVLPDTPGLLTARMVATAINEAWFVLEDKLGTKQQINVALKMGTARPMGPFEWGERIGLEKIQALLHELGKKDQRFRVAPALLKENEN